MKTQKNYKNVEAQILTSNNSAEPLNVMFSSDTELSSSCNLEGCSTLEKAVISRIPIQSENSIQMFKNFFQLEFPF